MIWARMGWALLIGAGLALVATVTCVALGQYGRAVVLIFAVYGFGQAAAGAFSLADSARARKARR